MIIEPIRTKRIQFPLRELSIGDAIALCEVPSTLHERGTTMALRGIIADDAIDPLHLTVQERAFVLAQYHAQTNGEEPDFTVGDGRYSDYLVYSEYQIDDKFLCEQGDDRWSISPLLGLHSESIERLILQERLQAKRHHWWAGAMASMLHNEATRKKPEWASMREFDIDEHIFAGATAFMSYPESAFLELLQFFLSGVESLDHLFRLDFQDDGIVFRQAREGSAALPPARFHFNTAVSETTYRVFGNATE